MADNRRTVGNYYGVNEDIPMIPGVADPYATDYDAQLGLGLTAAIEDNQADIAKRQAAAVAANNARRAAQAAPGAPTPIAGPTNAAGRQNAFDVTNTSTVDAAGNVTSNLAQPVGAGLTMGFGGGNETATQYLQRMQQSDQQAALNRQRTQLLDRFTAAQDNLSADSSIGEIGAARAQLAGLTPLLGATTGATADLARTDVGASADLARANIGAAAAIQERALANAGQLAAVDLTGQYGLQEASTRGQAAVGAALAKASLDANTGKNQKAAQEAQLLQLREALALQALENGEPERAAALASGATPATPKLINDNLGLPYAKQMPDGSIVALSPTELAQLAAARQQLATGGE